MAAFSFSAAVAYALGIAVCVLLAYARPAEAAKSVFVMRHCVRTTSNVTSGGASGFDNMNNYTALPWPAWPDNIAPYLCLPNGVQIITNQGRQLAQHWDVPKPIAITADSVTRDQTTSHALATGMGFPVSKIVTDHGPFGNGCKKQSHSELDKYIKANLKAHPLTTQYNDSLALLQSVTGKGAAPLLKDIANYVHHGYLEGGIEAGQGLAERLLMELGGNMTVGWGRVKDYIDVYKMLNVHSIARYLGVVVPGIQKNKGASITWHVVNQLSNQEAGSQFYVGHDDQLWSLAATLGLSWQTALPTFLPTLPGSMLRFDVDGDMVKASYLYTVFDSNSGILYSADAVFASHQSATIPLKDLAALSAANINDKCVLM